LNDRSDKLRPLIQLALDQGGVDAVVEVVCRIMDELEARIAAQNARITELERRLNKNSSNSSKPPSSDGLKRTKRDRSLRQKNSGRKPGGQPGHPGQTLRKSETPDTTVTVSLNICPECKGDLSAVAPESVEKRQVFDLPEIKMLITEYLAQRKRCPHCGKLIDAEFPYGVTAPVQYGPGMQGVMTYLNVRQVIPCERVAEVCADLFGHRPSAGSVVQAVARCADSIKPQIEEIRKTLRESPVLHVDETGVRCVGKTHWIHVVSTPTHSLYSYSEKRGKEGIAESEVLEDYNGTVVHDFWAAYDALSCDHSRCNAHLLRELKAFDEEGQAWAKNLAKSLLDLKKAADEARENNLDQIDSAHRKRLHADYDKWVKLGLKEHPEKTRPEGKRGRVGQSKETNLLRRLRDKREEVLHFSNDLSVPFDNNQAERDLRMIKVQQKVSGCFRSKEGAKRFCAISSFISTIRKQGRNVIETIKAAFASAPVTSGT
jgi:transposase